MNIYFQDIMERIRMHYKKMTNTERIIADFFLSNTEKMEFSAKAVAARLHVSEPAMTRFSKKIGFSGYREFQYLYEINFQMVQCDDEELLHRAILAAINSAVKDKDTIIYNLKSAMEKELAPVAGQQLSLSEIDRQLEQLNAEFSKVLAEASESGDQAAYSDRFRDIMQKQTALKSQRDEIQGMLAESGKAATHINQCREATEVIPAVITEWDEALIWQIVESVTVEIDSKLAVQMKSGAEIFIDIGDVPIKNQMK